MTHESNGFRDRGFSGSFAWDPGQGSGRGPSLTLSQTLGTSASGSVDALLGQRHLGALAANDNREYTLGWRLGLAQGGRSMGSKPNIGTESPHIGFSCPGFLDSLALNAHRYRKLPVVRDFHLLLL